MLKNSAIGRTFVSSRSTESFNSCLSFSLFSNFCLSCSSSACVHTLHCTRFTINPHKRQLHRHDITESWINSAAFICDFNVCLRISWSIQTVSKHF